MNIQIEQFNSNLQNLINSSNLPVGVVYYLFKYYTKELQNTYYATLNSELASSSSQEEVMEATQEEDNSSSSQD